MATCQRLGSPRPLWLHCLMARVEMNRLHGAWTAATTRLCAAPQTLAYSRVRLGCPAFAGYKYCCAPYFLGNSVQLGSNF